MFLGGRAHLPFEDVQRSVICCDMLWSIMISFNCHLDFELATCTIFPCPVQDPRDLVNLTQKEKASYVWAWSLNLPKDVDLIVFAFLIFLLHFAQKCYPVIQDGQWSAAAKVRTRSTPVAPFSLVERLAPLPSHHPRQCHAVDGETWGNWWLTSWLLLDYIGFLVFFLCFF